MNARCIEHAKTLGSWVSAQNSSKYNELITEHSPPVILS
jgi:hypothetical protein